MFRAGEKSFATFPHHQPQGQMLFEYFLPRVVRLWHILASAELHVCPRAAAQQFVTPLLTAEEFSRTVHRNRSFILSFTSPLVSLESTSSLDPCWQDFRPLRKYTKHNTICGVSVPWLGLQLPDGVLTVPSSEIKRASNRTNNRR